MQKAGEVLKSMEIAKMPPTEAPVAPRGLITKLCEVMALVKWIKKSGYNSFHNYAYATEADLADAIREPLAERHVFIFPDVVDVKRTPHEVETAKGGIRKTQLTEIMVRWTFVDGDTGESRDVHIPGVGEDASDKGFYKSFTGSEKYMLMKTFLIPTGDDPEAETKPEAADAKEKAKAVGAQVLAKKKELIAARKGPSFEPEGLYLNEWGEGFVELSGGGLTILRSEMTKEKADTLGLKKHPEKPALAIMPIANVFKLEDFCTKDLKPSLKMHWTGERAVKTALPPADEEQA